MGLCNERSKKDVSIQVFLLKHIKHNQSSSSHQQHLPFTFCIQPKYGMKNAACQLSAEEAEKICLAKFNEDDPRQHMMKVMVGCGINAGFWGSKEHARFSPHHIQVGHYPISHQNQKLAGRQYVAIVTMPNDKSQKLSVNNSYVRDTSDVFRFPVVKNDPKNFAASLLRLMEKLSPGQTRMYCKPAPPSYVEGLRMKGSKGLFYPSRPLGFNKVTEYIKEAGELMGLSVEFRPHSLRSVCITRLANDPSVSTSEMLAVSRHNSVAASRNYQKIDSASESNRLKALGISVSDEEKEDEKVKDEKDSCVGSDSKKRKGSDEMYDSELENLKKKGAKKEESVSMTQVAMDELKEELVDLKVLMDKEKAAEKEGDRKEGSGKSKNQLEIEELRSQVDTLKKGLRHKELDRETDQLIFDCVESDMQEEVEDLKMRLKIAQAENADLLRRMSQFIDEKKDAKKRSMEKK